MREELLAAINTAGLAQHMSKVQHLLLGGIMGLLKNNDQKEKTPQEVDALVLDGIGPAAASCAIDAAITSCKQNGMLQNVKLNGNYHHNHQLITRNDQYPNYSSVLRQFILPRYAWLDFDSMVDPRHMVDLECGYPRYITPIMYRYLYDRDDVAGRVVDIYPDESFAVEPLVTDDEDDDDESSPFKQDWKMLCLQQGLLQTLYRFDKVLGIGHYGVMLIGLKDSGELDQPLTGVNEDGTFAPNPPRREITYLRPFDEYLSFVQEFETDVNSPRYGMPKFYNLVFVDMTTAAAGATVGSRINRRVHWSRVQHGADNLLTGRVLGRPRMQGVFNRLLDLRKVKGSSAEMFWKGAWPGLSFEIDPRFIADNPEIDKDKLRGEVQDYMQGMEKYLMLLGVSAKSLAPQIHNPDVHVRVQLEAIALNMNMPIRVFMGSEEGKLASAQDSVNWNKRLGRRLRMFVEPVLIRGTIDRFVAIGAMRPPKNGKYRVGWGDLNTTTENDKANLALKWTQALSQYVASGVVHLISPADYMTTILGLHPREVIAMKKWMDENGGLAKLLKVDPSQGTGVNGKRQNQAGDTASSRSPNRKQKDRADKRIEGKSS